MADLTLYIANKNYSSWSLRPWLLLKQAGIDFEEVFIPLGEPGPDRGVRIRPHSPSGKVPALRHGSLVVWESLAIAEYVAELHPAAQLWPEDRAARAVARAVSAEMASGFSNMRAALSMNIRRKLTNYKVSDGAAVDVARVQEIWRTCRESYGQGGPFLFGRFSIADAMYAPVVTRFQTYGVAVDDGARAYMEAVSALPAMQAWVAAAHEEPHVIAAYEAITDAQT